MSEEQNNQTPPAKETSPVTSVALTDVVEHKGADGLNFFTDEHKEHLKLWASDDPTKAKFRTEDGKLDVPKLTKSYLELQNRLSRLSKPLADDATEAERGEYFRALRRMNDVPDTAEGYEFTPPTNLPDGVRLAESDMNQLRLILHNHAGSKDLAQALFDFGLKRDMARMQMEAKAAQDQHGEVERVLKAEWGPEAFARNDELLQRYLHDFCPDDDSFDKLYDDLQTTLFRGGSKSKEIFFKALCKAAEIVKGQGQFIAGEIEHKISERQRLKSQYPDPNVQKVLGIE